MKKQAKSIVDFEIKGMIKLTQDEQYNHDTEKKCFICKKQFFEDAKNNYIKIRDHCRYTGKYRGAAHKMCNLMYNTPREISVIFHNGSSYDYHFIIKRLVEEFDEDFECLGDNKEKYVTFSVPIKNESNEDRTIIYKIKFIDCFRFMSTSLSNLVDNLSEGFHDNGKYRIYFNIQKGRLLFECFDCKKRYRKKFDKKLRKKFKNTYNFCNGDYPYEYMDDWNRFDVEKLPDKSDFCSGLNMEEISRIDYRHAEKVFNEFDIKNLGEYSDLYLQSDTLLLADVFENFRNMHIKVYGLDPVYFLSALGLAWQACLKKTGKKIELITDVDMLLMIEKGIKRGICHSVYRHAKANSKYMKIHDKNNEPSYIIYMDGKNLYRYAMSKKLLVHGFEWVEDLSSIDEDFIKKYDKDSNVRYFIEADVEYPKDHINSLKQALNHGLILKMVHRTKNLIKVLGLKSILI